MPCARASAHVIRPFPLSSYISSALPLWPVWHLLQDRTVSRNDFLEALGNSLPVEHVYLNRQVGVLARFLQP